LVFVASAWVPPGPGADGSWNGNAVAFTGVLVVDVLEVAGDADGAGVLEVLEALEVLPPSFSEKVPPLACDGSGAEPETIATAGLPLPCEITNIAGCCLVAPPTGTIDTARWRPGVSWTVGVGAAAAGRAAVVGDDTIWPKETSVPRSVARTGWY
jgi:hypothetical protein